MKITEDFAPPCEIAEQAISEEETLPHSIVEKLKELRKAAAGISTTA